MADIDDDLLDEDDELAEHSESKAGDAEPELGEQADGSLVVEVKDEPAEKTAKEENVVAEGGDDNERERIREQRRQERIDKKQRAKEREERMKRELESERSARRQLEERMSMIERRSTGAEIAQLDTALAQTRQAHAHFKEQIRLGQEQNNGAMIADATEKMMQAQQRFNQLTNVKQAYQQRQSAPAPLDPSLTRHANDFMAKHTWYRPDGNDNDSAITRTIDNNLAAEGFDPKTSEYWQELEARVKKYLPHRAGRATVSSTGGNGQGEQAKPKSVVAGSGREGQSSVSPKGTFKLSPARVSAMKEAGVWDDPKKRDEAIRRYRDYDKENKGR
jgi:hypothetical protein